MINSLIGISTWIIVIILSGIYAKKKLPEQGELSRKIIHIGIGPVIPFAWWAGINETIAISVSLVITIGLIVNKKLGIVNAFEDIDRKSYGTIAYGLAITLLLTLFWSNNPGAVSAGILVMAFGDGFAGLIGRKIKSYTWTIWGQKKSIAGTITMGITTGLIITLQNILVDANIGFIAIIGITMISVILEQISKLGIDNITVPFGTALMWYLLTSQ